MSKLLNISLKIVCSWLSISFSGFAICSWAHADVVVSLIMYFGSLYLFIPAQKVLLEGVQNKGSTWSAMKKDMKNATTDVAKNYAKEKFDEAGLLPTGIASGESDHADANDDKGMDRESKNNSDRNKRIDEMHEKLQKMTIGDTVKCLNKNGKNGADVENATLGQIRNLCGDA